VIKYIAYCPQAQFVMFEYSGPNPQVENPAKELEILRAFLAK
jgi:proline iminopeptidase